MQPDPLSEVPLMYIYRIWYVHPAASAMLLATSVVDEALNMRPQNLRKQLVAQTHRCVLLHTAQPYETDKNVLNDIYRYCQAEVWSPNGEAVPLIKTLGLEHTSMSMGDVIEDTSSGRMWVVAHYGFNEIQLE